MDQPKYNTLNEALKTLTDPRKPRGKRYPWHFLLQLIALALASGQHTVHGIAHWVTLHADELRTALNWQGAAFPSESTLRRTVRWLAPKELETVFAALTTQTCIESTAPPVTEEPVALQAEAVDGKQLRGVRAHNQPHVLVSLVRHDAAQVVGQTAVAAKSNEITAVPPLLAGRDLTDTVLTMDALLTQRTLATQILSQHGHYFMVVKRNQRELYDAIEFLFQNPPWTKQEQAQEYWQHTTQNQGHGRREERTLECSTALCGYLAWPQVGQVMQRTCRRIDHKTGLITTQVRYGITSLTPHQASAAALEKLWRGHWTIENRVHRVRDVTLGEDAGQVHAGHAPQVLAAFRNMLLNLWRANGWQNIADAVRFYASKVTLAFALISTRPSRL